jgi:hypothetical protein
MKTNLYYILNVVTDQSYDTIEGKFFSSNWSPELSDDKAYLKLLMRNDPKKFENCKIVKVKSNE